MGNIRKLECYVCKFDACYLCRDCKNNYCGTHVDKENMQHYGAC